MRKGGGGLQASLATHVQQYPSDYPLLLNPSHVDEDCVKFCDLLCWCFSFWVVRSWLHVFSSMYLLDNGSQVQGRSNTKCGGDTDSIVELMALKAS